MSLIRKSILTITGSFVYVILGVLTQMILARKLMPEGMGQYQVFFSTATLAAALTSLGIGQAGIYYLNRKKRDVVSVVMNGLYWCFFCGIALVVTLSVVVKTFVGYFGELPFLAILGYAIGVTGILLVNLLRPVLVAALRMTEAVIVTTALPAAYLILVLLLALTGRLWVGTALVAMAFGHIISATVLLFFLRKDISLRCGFSFKLFRDMLAYGLKLFLSNVILIANVSIGLLLLRRLMIEDFSQVGYFGRAMAICALTQIVTSSVTGMLYAKWSDVSSTERVLQVERAFRMHVAVSAAILLCTFAFGKWAIIFLYTKAFLPAVAPMYILIVAQILMSTTSIHANLLAGDGKPLLNALVFGIPIPVLVVMMLVLTPRFGIIGAAWAQMLSSLAGLCLATAIITRMYGIRLKSSLILNKSDIHYIKQSLLKKKYSYVEADVDS